MSTSEDQKQSAETHVLEQTTTLTSPPTLGGPDKVALSNVTTVAESREPSIEGRDKEFTNSFEYDLETGVEMTSSTDKVNCTKKNAKCHRVSDLRVWPSRDHWKQQAKAAKLKRGCSCMAKMSKRNRILAKVGIVILVVLIAVGVGIGISRSLR